MTKMKQMAVKIYVATSRIIFLNRDCFDVKTVIKSFIDLSNCIWYEDTSACVIFLIGIVKYGRFWFYKWELGVMMTWCFLHGKEMVCLTQKKSFRWYFIALCFFYPFRIIKFICCFKNIFHENKKMMNSIKAK